MCRVTLKKFQLSFSSRWTSIVELKLVKHDCQLWHYLSPSDFQFVWIPRRDSVSNFCFITLQSHHPSLWNCTIAFIIAGSCFLQSGGILWFYWFCFSFIPLCKPSSIAELSFKQLKISVYILVLSERICVGKSHTC